MTRLALTALLLVACRTTPSRAVEHVGRAKQQGEARRAPSPSFAFRLRIPQHDGQILLYEVAANGDMVQWYTPSARPEPPARIRMQPDGTLWDSVHEAPAFGLRDDGVFAYMRRDADEEGGIACERIGADRIRCRCDGHVPLVDVTYSIAGSDVVATTSSAREVIGRVEPAPRNAAQRRRALVLIALWSYSRDDHGDSAHDIDY